MKILGLLIFVSSLWATTPSSSVTITEQLGSGQTNRPIQLHRIFARGEITHYALPTVSGGIGVPSVWQNDVKQRWRDSTGTCTVTAASNASPIHITASNCGYQEGESVTVSGVGGNTAANATRLVRKVSNTGFDMMNTTGNGSYTSGGSVTGPGPGSLRDVIISFPLSLSASTGYTVSFTDTTDQCSSGNTAACNAASLDVTGMLAFNGGTWDATISTLADDGGSGIAHSASARTMMGNGTIQANLEYYLRGPAMTQVIMRDLTKIYSWGYDCTGTFTGTDCNAAWANDATNLSLTPTFVLGFPTSWAGTRIYYMLENTWTDSLQDQRYKLTLSNSGGTVESPFNLGAGFGMPHYARSSWVREYWDGSEPGGSGHYKDSVVTDLGISYLVYSKVVPSYLSSISPSGTAMTSFTTALNTNTTSGHNTLVCPNTSTCGNIEMAMVSGGSRNSAVGLLNNYESLAVIAQSTAGLNLIETNARLGALIPVFEREASSRAISYDPGGQFAAQYRWISRIARPTVSILTGTGCQVAGDLVTPVATLVSPPGWAVDGGHFPTTSYSAYLMTGDWIYVNFQQGLGTFLTMNNNGADAFVSGKTPWLGSCGGFVQTIGSGGRYVAWPMREQLYASMVAPDGSAEQDYFRYAFLQGAEYYEGYFQCGTGCQLFETQLGNSSNVFVPSTDVLYWAGFWKFGAWPNALKLGAGGGSSDGWANEIDQNKHPVFNFTITDLWMQSFLPTTWGMAAQYGFPVGDLVNSMAVLYTTGLLTSLGSPSVGMVQEYVTPTVDFSAAPMLTAAINTTDLTLHVDAVPGWTSYYPIAAVMWTTKDITAASQSPMSFTVATALSGLANNLGVRLSGLGGMTYANCGWLATNVGVGQTTFDVVVDIKGVSGNPMTISTNTSCLHAGQTVVVTSVGGCTAANATWTLGTITGTSAVLSGSGACNSAYTSGGSAAPYGDSAWTSGGVATAFSGPEYIVLESESSGASTITVKSGGRNFIGSGGAAAHSAGALIFPRLPYQTWNDVLNGYNSAEKAVLQAFTTADYVWGSDSESYQALGAASFGTAAANGQAAYDVIGNARAASSTATTWMNGDPKWAFGPYQSQISTPTTLLKGKTVVNGKVVVH